MTMKPDKILTKNDDRSIIENETWGKLSFGLNKKNDIIINGSASLPSRRYFEKIEFYSEEGFIVAQSTDSHSAPLYFLNKNGDVATNYNELTDVVHDDGYTYLVTYKMEKGQNGRWWRCMYLIDVDDMRSTIQKWQGKSSRGLVCELCDLQYGLMVLKDNSGNYIFNAVHNYPGSFIADNSFTSIKNIGKYKYKVNENSIGEDELDLTSKMKKYTPHTNNGSNVEKSFKSLMIRKKNNPMHYVRRMYSLGQIDWRRGHGLSSGDGILVATEENNKVRLFEYKENNIMMPLVTQYEMENPLPNYIRQGISEIFDCEGLQTINSNVNIGHLIENIVRKAPRGSEPKAAVLPYIPSDNDNESMIYVFENNIELLDQGWYMIPSGKVYVNTSENIKSKLYRERIECKATDIFDTRIEVRHIDCLEVAREMSFCEEAKGRVAVLNMANARDPQLRVISGAKEQEAYLMRCTDYYHTLSHMKEYYPITGENDGIYTHDVTVFRKPNYEMEAEPWKVNIIAVAGLPRPVNGDEGELLAYILGFQKKIRTILRIAIANGQTKLVLGAMGCGGLKNIPKTIAKIFHFVLTESEFKQAFEHIVFAMLPVEGADETYDAFFDEFKDENGFVGKIDECLKDEFEKKRRSLIDLQFDVEGMLSDSDARAMIFAADKQMLNEEYTKLVLGKELPNALLLMGSWLQHNQCDSLMNIDYLIEVQENQEKLNEIMQMFIYEMEDTQGWSSSQVYDQLTDDYDGLLIAIGYLYAVQELKNEDKEVD